MLHADAALFAGLGHYFAGIAQIHLAELNGDESDALRSAAATFRQAYDQIQAVTGYEERILALAERIDYSAYFVRRHEVASHYTARLLQGLDQMIVDLSDGYYPAEACSQLNPVMARMMANFEQDARVEGVLTRLERLSTESEAGGD